MPAVKADERGQRVAIELHQTAPGEARGVAPGLRRRWTNYSAADLVVSLAPRFASIWPMASTTASKVSSVEAWRAL